MTVTYVHRLTTCGLSKICCNRQHYRFVMPLIMTVATNLENLEYSGISLNMENSGNSVNSVQLQGKMVTNKVFMVRHSNICVKQLLTG